MRGGEGGKEGRRWREAGRKGGRLGSIVRPKKDRYKKTVLISEGKDGLTRNARVSLPDLLRLFYQPLVFLKLLELSTGPPSPVKVSPVNREKEKGRGENRSKE